ncbi:MAG: isopenicillin N synthase family oxygenase [Hyphomicrobiales bacterium]|nr:isopenicillin N synthase family oxygenase [Hyphomicrobiales bacterium]
MLPRDRNDPVPAANASLPIVDVSSDDIRLIGAQIGHAARDVGFFFVAGHNIPVSLIDSVFQDSERFFALPLAEKERLSIRQSRHNRGYVATGGESLDPTRPADLKEAFNIGLDLAPDDTRVVAGEPFRGANLWPETLPGWRETMLEYFDAVWALGRRLHRGIATDLGVDAGFFDDKLDAPMAVLRLLHYPPAATLEPGQMGAGAHTDYGNLTLLLTDSVGGLQVQTRSGEWILVPSMPGTFVCNIGDALMRWTNDVYVSTPHRVLNRGADRYSVAFFLDPNPEAGIACLPACVSPERPARYQPVTAAAHLMERLARTCDFLEER